MKRLNMFKNENLKGKNLTNGEKEKIMKNLMREPSKNKKKSERRNLQEKREEEDQGMWKEMRKN